MVSIWSVDEVSVRREVQYNRKRPLEAIFQNTTARILDFLVLNQKFDYSAPEISKITQIPLRTLQRVLPHLVKKQMIKETGRVGNTRMYMLNTSSELTSLLRQFVLASMNIEIDTVLRRQKTISKL
jgi:response regulator of citrate/malate metabolism